MSFSELAARARGQWDHLVPALAPAPELVEAIQRGHRKHGRCPKHGGENGDAFRVFPDFSETGGACCNTCGVFTSGFALLAWIQEWDWGRVASAVEAYLGGSRSDAPTPRRRTQPKAKPADRAPPMAVLNDLWGDGCGIQGTSAKPLREYLAGRGLDGLSPRPYVRFHPKLLYVDGKTRQLWPGMLARITAPNGRHVGLHRTYLDPWNATKALVRAPKKVLRAKGETLTTSAIRLYPVATTMGLTEGIETAIAVQKATGMPVWATTCATLLRSAVLPDAVEHVVVWADRDAAGRDAAMAAAERFREEGRSVEVRYPRLERKSDWNDVLREQGVEGFPERHRRRAG